MTPLAVPPASPATLDAFGAPELSAADFVRVAELTRDVAGINLHAGKEGLVRARLARRLRARECPTYAAYLDLVAADRTHGELREMVDALTTNKTSFFRESAHFDFLAESVLPAIAAEGRAPRLWSAGCSSGEEPYTLAMVVRETLPAPLADATRILATDISSRMVARATAATYTAEVAADVGRERLRRHFAAERDGALRVADPLRRMVRVARLNLMGAWPMRGPFDAILCRNVMIYFDKPTQAALVDRFRELLAPGGHLLVGHSESLTGLAHRFRYVRPAVYVK